MTLLTIGQPNSAFEQRVRKTLFFPATETGENRLTDPRDCYFRALGYFMVGDFTLSDQWLDSVSANGNLDTNQISRFYLLKGRVRRLLGDNLGAVTMFDSALVVSKRERYINDEFRTYVDLLEHCRALIMFEEGEVYKDKLNRLVKDPEIMPDNKARYLHRKAAYLIEAEDSLELVPTLLEECIAYCREFDLPWHEATALLDLGYITFTNSGDDGLQYFEQAEKIWQRLGYRRDLTQVRFNIARFYSQQGRYEEALKKLDVVYGDALKYNWPIQAATVWKVRSEVYSFQGKDDQALEAYHTYHDLYTRILADRIDEQVAEMVAKVGAQSARNDLLVAENAMLIAEEELETESNRRKLLLLTIVSMGLILGGMYVFYQRSRQANILLRSQQNTIESTNRKLELALEQKNHLYRELHHRVKNNLTILSGLLYMQSFNLESEEAKKALTEARARIQSMSLLHQGLYQRDEAVEVKMSAFMEELMPNLLSSFSYKANNVDWSIEFDEIDLEIDKAMPLAMIVNELVTNSFKYAFDEKKKGILKVTGKKSGAHDWVIKVLDNGPGMPEDFDWSSSNTMGMRLVNILVEEMGASFVYGRSEGFSEFSVVFESSRK